MTQEYKIIHCGEHLYMVDNGIIAEGDWVIVGNITAINYRIEKVCAEYLPHVQEIQKIMNSEKFPVKDKVKTVRILASTDESLQLPLLPKVEEDIEMMARQFLLKEGFINYKQKDALGNKDVVQIVVDFYKAASKKKYTEEDMFRALDYGFSKGMARESFSSYDYLQSLTPKPKQVEVELEPYNIIDGKKQYCAEGYDDLSSMPDLKYEPKTKDNIVVIKKWIYENTN